MSTAYPPEGETPKEHRISMGRRQLLKTLVAAGWVAAASTLLPSKWVKPLVEVGVLPAHAQASAPTPMCYTPTPSHTPTPSPMCYTPTPSHTPTPTPTLLPRCYTPTPFVPSSQDRTPQPPASPTPEARQALLEQLLAEGRFPQDVASKLQAGEN
jgi:hypothetical protein